MPLNGILKPPTTNNPTTTAPTTTNPTTTSPTTSNPTTSIPTTSLPTTSNPTQLPTNMPLNGILKPQTNDDIVTTRKIDDDKLTLPIILICSFAFIAIVTFICYYKNKKLKGKHKGYTSVEEGKTNHQIDMIVLNDEEIIPIITEIVGSKINESSVLQIMKTKNVFCDESSNIEACGDSRMSDRFLSNVSEINSFNVYKSDDLDSEEEQTEDVDNDVEMYNFGIQWQYWKKYELSKYYVVPRYNNLKDELLNNIICC
eukprot:472043_1